jgi:hypothetical protein
MNKQNFNAGQSVFKGAYFVGQYVGFNLQKQKIVTFDGVIGKYREFDSFSVSPNIKKY